jgi:hypothetical protein
MAIVYFLPPRERFARALDTDANKGAK